MLLHLGQLLHLGLQQTNTADLEIHSDVTYNEKKGTIICERSQSKRVVDVREGYTVKTRR